MKKTQAKGIILLFICAFVWGSSFVAQAEGMETIEGFTFNGIRMLIGAVTLLPFILVKDLGAKRKPSFDRAAYKKELKSSVTSGLIIGVVLTIASNFQQFAFNYSTPGKIAFITAFYMFLVPIFGLFLKRRPSPVIWGCVALGVVGLYLLCVKGGDFASVNRGDLLALICAVFYAVHILCVEKLEGATDPLKLSAVQFFVTGVISCTLMLIFEHPDINAILSCWLPILYSGCLSCSVAYTFQILGQRYAEPTVASLIMCTESVFGVLCAAVFYMTMPSGRELAGCGVMFLAIVLSQLAPKFAEKKKNSQPC